MKKVFVCSPYRGNIELNSEKARGYCRVEIAAGNIPFSPHLFFPQFLNDANSMEREAGIRAGLEIMKHCDELHVWGGEITEGMKKEIACWREMGRKELHCSVVTLIKRQETP